MFNEFVLNLKQTTHYINETEDGHEPAGWVLHFFQYQYNYSQIET
jgi:hypothetical protein